MTVIRYVVDLNLKTTNQTKSLDEAWAWPKCGAPDELLQRQRSDCREIRLQNFSRTTCSTFLKDSADFFPGNNRLPNRHYQSHSYVFTESYTTLSRSCGSSAAFSVIPIAWSLPNWEGSLASCAPASTQIPAVLLSWLAFVQSSLFTFCRIVLLQRTELMVVVHTWRWAVALDKCYWNLTLVAFAPAVTAKRATDSHHPDSFFLTQWPSRSYREWWR